ncbi:MAG: filamentous hemagglutinin N-terminal domain-containing protein, partial [Pseudomonadota bacterium]
MTHFTLSNPLRQPRRLFKHSALALLVAAACASSQGAPKTPQVVNGAATFTQNGNVYTITNTPNTIINWDAFSIEAGEITRFVQESASSAVLNRILGQDPTRILGALQSNGRVFLINPNGIMFGAGARVDVGGLAASTLNIGNADFIAGKHKFEAGPVAGAVVNDGRINAAGGGRVFLIAPNVENNGVITAPGGEVVLAAGHTVQLVDAGDPSLHVVVSAPSSGAINLGRIIAHGGQVGIYGALVGQRGVVNANSAQMGANGKIVLRASGDTVLGAGSVTSAIGAGNGGDIEVLGRRVGLLGDAVVDASGATGGGKVLVGGDYQGQNALVMNAQNTYFGKDAVIRADALGSGKGGTVVLWGDATTRAYGRISARGVDAGGGLVETSGHYLDVTGVFVDAGSLTGGLGRWLLDPYDIEINTRGTSQLSEADSFAAGSQQGVTYIHPDLLSNAQSSVVLQAMHDITFSSAVNIGGAGVSLTAHAGNNINVLASLGISGGGALTLSANSALTTGRSGSGAVFVHAPVNTNGSRLFLTGADVYFGNNAFVQTGTGGAELSVNRAEGAINFSEGTALTGSGAFTMTADNMSLNGVLDLGGAGGAGKIQIAPYSSGRNTVIGYEGGANQLTLSPQQLRNIHAGDLAISTGSQGNFALTAGFVPDPGMLGSLEIRSAGAFDLYQGIDLRNSGTGRSLLTLKTLGGGRMTVNAEANLVADGILMRADSIGLYGTATAGLIALSTTTDGTAIALGANAADTNGVLAFDQGELGRLQTGQLQIGVDSGSATITVNEDVNVPLLSSPSNTLTLKSGAGDINLNASLASPGLISLEAGNGYISTGSTQGGTGRLTATALTATGASVDLSGPNQVGVVAGRANYGDFNFSSNNQIDVRSLNGLAGISAAGTIRLASAAGISQSGDAPLQAYALLANAANDVILTAPGNMVSMLAGSGTSFGFRNGQSLELGANESGISLLNPALGSFLSVEALGTITVKRNLDAGVGNLNLSAGAIRVGALPVQTEQRVQTMQTQLPVQTETTIPTSSVSLTGGHVNLQATAPASGSLSVLAGNAVNAAYVLNVSADQVHLDAGAQLNSPTGTVNFMPFSLNRAIDIGAGALDSAGTLGLSEAELQMVNAQALHVAGISEPISNPINFVGALDLSGSVNLKYTSFTGADINLNAPVKTPGQLTFNADGGAIALNNSVQAQRVTLSGRNGINGSGVVRGLDSVFLLSQKNIGSGAAPIDIETRVLDVENNAPGGNLPINIRSNLATPGALVLSSVTQSGSGNTGTITVSNSGPMTVSGNVQTNGGALTLSATDGLDVHGQLSSNGGAIGMFGGGAIALSGGAGTLSLSADSAVVAGGGNIDLVGATGISQAVSSTLIGNGVYLNSQGAAFLSGGGNLVNSLYGSAQSIGFNNSLALTLGYFTKGLTLNGATAQSVIDIKTPYLLRVGNALDAGPGYINLQGGSIQLGANAPAAVSGAGVNLVATTPSTGIVKVQAGSAVTVGSILQVVADQVELAPGAMLNAPTGSVVFSPMSAGRTIAVGAGALDSAQSLGLSEAELQAVNAQLITVVDNTELKGSTLNVVGALDLGAKTGLTQLFLSGGDVNVNGAVKVPGVLVVAAGSGKLNVNAPLQAQTVSLDGPGGIFGGAAGTVRGESVSLSSKYTIGTDLAPIETQAQYLFAENTVANGTQPINIRNNFATPGPLTVLNAQQLDASNNGSITINNYGGMAVAGTVKANAGAVTLATHSPLTVTSTGVVETSTGNISLNAGNGGNLTVAQGGRVTSGTGNISLTAGGQLSVAPGSVTTGGVVAQAATPLITDCIANPALFGCTAVILAATDVCIADPSGPNCAALLPSMTTCIAAPTTYGCSAVLPTLAACTGNPSLTGCSVVLPSLAVCTSAPTTAGCSAVLPSLATCTESPTTAGCGAVLPSLALCTQAPATAGCSVVLPSLATCTESPTTAGCSAVLPSIAVCTSAPTTAGCSAVLPSLATCTQSPTTAGCSAVLPSIAVCTSAPTTAGCSAVLPSLATCTQSPTTAGCSAVLPSIAVCTSAPSTAGCSAVLPSLAT